MAVKSILFNIGIGHYLVLYHVPVFTPKILTSQSLMVQETVVTGENHQLSHWQLSHSLKLYFMPTRERLILAQINLNNVILQE